MGFSTPFRMFKRYSYQGGVCDPLVVHWPAGMQARGEVRSQYHHCTDIVPTIYECCGITPPDTVLGYEQSELPGVSMRYSSTPPTRRRPKQTQYYEMLGTRGIWHKGWKAVTEHAPMPSGKGHFDQDRWQLFHTDEDRSEAARPRRAAPREGQGARRPVVRRGGEVRRAPAQRPRRARLHQVRVPGRGPEERRLHYFPGTAEVPERSAANVHGVSYKILAEVEIADQSAQGVILAQGSRFGGHALFVKDGRLHYVYNFLGIKPEQHLESEPLEPGAHVLGVEFARSGPASTASPTAPPSSTSTRTSSPRARCAPSPGTSRSAAKASRSAATPATPSASSYTPFFPFEGGTIVKVEVSTGDDAYVDLEQQLRAALARD